MKLNDIRKNIDTIDGKILHLLQNRFKLAKEIGRLKQDFGLPMEDKRREEEIITNLVRKGKKLNLSKSFIIQLFDLIINESKRIQRK